MHLEEVLHESQRVYDIVVYRDNDIVRITLQSPVILVMRLEVSIAPSDVHPRPSQFIKLDASASDASANSSSDNQS